MKSHPLHLRPNTAKNKERKKLGRPILAPMSSSLWYISTKFLFLTPFFLLLSICICWFGSWTLQAYKACACPASRLKSQESAAETQCMTGRDLGPLLQCTRLVCPLDFPGNHMGVDCHFLLQGIFLSQGLNWSLLWLLHWRVDSLPPSHHGSPRNGINLASFPSFHLWDLLWLWPWSAVWHLSAALGIVDKSKDSLLRSPWFESQLWQFTPCRTVDSLNYKSLSFLHL